MYEIESIRTLSTTGSLQASVAGVPEFKNSILQSSRRGPRRKYMPKVKKEDFWPDSEYTRPKEEVRNVTWKESVLPSDLAEMRYKYPDFLPIDDPNYRHHLAIKLERADMLRRRANIGIPEFYVGSILAVTVSDPNAPGKMSRFVGICIERTGQGLRANFTLRNHIGTEGVEIRYPIYNPTIRAIECLKLEKRLDEHLLYLRDAEPEFSTFPMDMEAELRDPNQSVPVNPLKVRMKPWPWTQSWEVQFPLIRGIEKLENVPDWYYLRSRKSHSQYEKYDLMQQYRSHIPEEDQVEIWAEVQKHEQVYGERRKAEKRSKLLKKE